MHAINKWCILACQWSWVVLIKSRTRANIYLWSTTLHTQDKGKRQTHWKLQFTMECFRYTHPCDLSIYTLILDQTWYIWHILVNRNNLLYWFFYLCHSRPIQLIVNVASQDNLSSSCLWGEQLIGFNIQLTCVWVVPFNIGQNYSICINIRNIYCVTIMGFNYAVLTINLIF